jgi:uncharacterized protein YndB with AHSA1/START domain
LPTTTRTRTLGASPDAVWKVVGDPHHLPRWWPKVRRVEDVEGRRFTKVFVTEKGRPVRADYEVLETDAPHSISWSQEVEDSPFERLLDESVTTVRLAPAGDGTEVSLAMRQKLRGWARFAPFLVRHGSRRLLDEALEGLDRCVSR